MAQTFSFSLLFLFLLTTQISALTLLELLKTTPELSTLYNRVNASSYLTGFFANSTDFTLLAPSNDAFSKTANMSDEEFTAVMQYSMLKGGYPKAALDTERVFVNSNLNNTAFANVTAGQVVGLGLDAKKEAVEVLSGNRTISSSSKNIVCVGGLLHIIDEVISIPISSVLEITAAGLEYFIAILAKGSFLTTGSSYVNPVVYEPNITFFIPNSPEALASFNELAKTATPSDFQTNFLYHVIPNFVGYSPMLTDGLSLKSQMGTNLTIHVQDGQTYVNSAKILQTDYIISNGVIHVIDSVLNATNITGPPPSTAGNKITPTDLSTASSATSTAGSASPPAGSSSSSKLPLSIGAIVGIAVGGFALLLLLSTLVFCCIRSQKEKKRKRLSIANTPMQGLTYEGPTGEALYANRYHMTREVGSGRYKVERDSGMSHTDGSPLSAQDESVSPLSRTGSGSMAGLTGGYNRNGGWDRNGEHGMGLGVRPLRVDTKGANIISNERGMPPSAHSNERPVIPQRSPSRGVINKGGGSGGGGMF
ncbi:hypothetical protein HYFRA_00002168 [Hymenoscyphus fraxineus]|uniref:FAS1 domain-containing protein n=1 Tax=Hymenoscyphus fraxineus TaxID=746836 RepID=A0A9N9PMK8_9HELO|nr:hypothetical protein HYFRA_00002168 [Hymenoscyphus fraxineus]